MKYQLVYLKRKREEIEEFDSIWETLKRAIAFLEETDMIEYEILGIKHGPDLLGKSEWVLRSGSIHALWLTLANCPDNYWRE